jgi:hypothetical protein
MRVLDLTRWLISYLSLDRGNGYEKEDLASYRPTGQPRRSRGR